MGTLSCHNRKSIWTMTVKLVLVEAIVMNIAANFQLYFPYSFWGDAFAILFHKINFSVAMTTNEIEVFENDVFERDLNERHFCNTFLKISAIHDNFHFSHYKSMET